LYPKEIYQEIKQTFCYQGITEPNGQWLLEFFSARKSDVYKLTMNIKKSENGVSGKFYSEQLRELPMRHRFQIVPIVGDAKYPSLKYSKRGVYFGSIEEFYLQINTWKYSPFCGSEFRV